MGYRFSSPENWLEWPCIRKGKLIFVATRKNSDGGALKLMPLQRLTSLYREIRQLSQTEIERLGPPQTKIQECVHVRV